LLLKVAERGFVTIDRECKYSIENDYNEFAALHFHSVNSAHLNITVRAVFSRRNV